MLKRLSVWGLLAAVALLGLTVESEANGSGDQGLFRRRGGLCSKHGRGDVKYIDQKVTAYKYVWTPKEMDVVVCKNVVSLQKYMYTVTVPVYENRTIKTTVNVRQQQEVEYKYFEMVPRVVTRTVQKTTYQCINERVCVSVPVCKMIRIQTTDRHGECVTRLQKVTVLEQRSQCVVKKIPTVKDVVVSEVVCDQVEKVAKKIVCRTVPEVRDVTIRVCTFKQEQREGTRRVTTVVHEKTKQIASVCERVPYEATVRIAVDSCGNQVRPGLFRRAKGCCN